MSILRCASCERQVDTDTDAECVEIVGGGEAITCKPCREEVLSLWLDQCPDCGGRARVISGIADKSRDQYMAECVKCLCATGYFPERIAAANVWNARAKLVTGPHPVDVERAEFEKHTLIKHPYACFERVPSGKYLVETVELKWSSWLDRALLKWVSP